MSTELNQQHHTNVAVLFERLANDFNLRLEQVELWAKANTGLLTRYVDQMEGPSYAWLANLISEYWHTQYNCIITRHPATDWYVTVSYDNNNNFVSAYYHESNEMVVMTDKLKRKFTEDIEKYAVATSG